MAPWWWGQGVGQESLKSKQNKNSTYEKKDLNYFTLSKLHISIKLHRRLCGRDCNT